MLHWQPGSLWWHHKRWLAEAVVVPGLSYKMLVSGQQSIGKIRQSSSEVSRFGTIISVQYRQSSQRGCTELLGRWILLFVKKQFQYLSNNVLTLANISHNELLVKPDQCCFNITVMFLLVAMTTGHQPVWKGGSTGQAAVWPEPAQHQHPQPRGKTDKHQRHPR